MYRIVCRGTKQWPPCFCMREPCPPPFGHSCLPRLQCSWRTRPWTRTPARVYTSYPFLALPRMGLAILLFRRADLVAAAARRLVAVDGRSIMRHTRRGRAGVPSNQRRVGVAKQGEACRSMDLDVREIDPKATSSPRRKLRRKVEAKPEPENKDRRGPG